MALKERLLEVRDFKAHFHTERGRVTAVNGVSFTMNEGEIIGIVGESGCGKSVMAQSILRLLEHTDDIECEGEIIYNGRNLLGLPLSKLRAIRGTEISMIFQDPLSSLNPVYTIGDQIAESLRLHQKLSKREARARAIEMLWLTGIPAPEVRVDEYPHQLSGGMRQRAMIALALSCQPKLLIADEPTTALDVTIQAQILDLIVELNRRLGMGVLFISHDLGVVAEVCDSVKVMYLGQIVEEASADELFSRPLHPYTQGLIQSIPKLDGDRGETLHAIAGAVPSLMDIPQGCRFSNRCPFADEQCLRQEPVMESISQMHGRESTESVASDRDHRVKCWHYAKISGLDGRGSSGE